MSVSYDVETADHVPVAIGFPISIEPSESELQLDAIGEDPSVLAEVKRANSAQVGSRNANGSQTAATGGGIMLCPASAQNSSRMARASESR